MIKKSVKTIFVIMAICLMFSCGLNGFAQEAQKATGNATAVDAAAQEEQKVTGKVTAVDVAAKTLSIENQQYAVSDEVMTYFDVEVGDEVELVIENTDKGPVVVDYFYI